jgi:hypothetical protein
MKKGSSLCFLLLLTIAAYAQKSNFIGRYNGTKPELAQELVILPDGHFIFSLSYGAVDKLISGQWTANGDKIRLIEKKTAMEPFIVYGRHSSTLNKGKLFIFQEYAQNTGIAFSFADIFDASRFKLIHLKNQHTFSHTNKLNVTSKPVTTFFLSKPMHKNPADKGEVKVYEFTPAAEWNEFMLFYNRETEDPPFVIEAALNGNTLMIQNNDRESTSFGRKEELPANFNIDNYQAYFKEGTDLPDSLSRRDTSDNQITYHLIKSRRNFSSTLNIKQNEAYFEPEKDFDKVPVEPVVTELPPLIIPEIKSKGKKKAKN